MDSALQPATLRATTSEPLRVVPIGQALNVGATYHLSEAGRKASLLEGGDGKAVQRLTLQVPAARLHLISVDLNGVASLKLQPRFERVDGQDVVRRDGPPTYDVPPSVEDLFKEAARNHELEREYQSNRSRSRDGRREADRDRRLKVAEEFFSDPSQRAMVHPIPTLKRCFMGTGDGRVMFDAATDVGPARDVPREKYRRFRADLRARKERHVTLRAQQLALHDEKMRVVADWVGKHGSADQRERHAAGLLPIEEVIDKLANEAFAAVDDVPRYPLDGASRLEQHLCLVTGRPNIAVSAGDLQVFGIDARVASAAQWALVQQLEAQLPDADVRLRQHRLSSRREPDLPPLTVFGVLVTRHVGPFILRREFAAPGR